MKNAYRWLPFVLGLMLTASADAPAAVLTPPMVPTDIEVPAGQRLFLRAHATGTQDYTCTIDPVGPSGPPIGWAPYGPQATLFSDDGSQVMTHFLSPSPLEAGLPRPTWQHSRDTSVFWGKLFKSSSDPSFVEPGAIPWLRLDYAGTRFGPRGGGRLAYTSHVQRVNTSGGPAPATGCVDEADIGKKALVPYSADYYFYTPVHRVRSK
jgi:hypothetical protein